MAEIDQNCINHRLFYGHTREKLHGFGRCVGVEDIIDSMLLSPSDGMADHVPGLFNVKVPRPMNIR